MGRRKIEMELVKNKEARTVTFSKRRSGLFKKANELSVLCGVQVGIVGFSFSGVPFSLGIPNIDVVTDKFLYKGSESSGRGQDEPSRNGEIDELSEQLEDLMKQLKVGKKKKKKKEEEEEKPENVPNKVPIVDDGLDLEGLQKLKASLKELRDDLELKLFLIDLEAASSLLLLAKKPAVKRVK